ncbi:MAG TPA: helix-turn-helix domain-containing protein [Candidatus Sulfotelmatobacter sp.]|nr:helix-turn-helix domain-containing protein [Candidatus Sulfotelmatobacter sp.]
MRWDETIERSCPVARSLSLLGDRWTLLLILEVFLGSRRFEEFEALLGISPHLLSRRLARLVADGILRKEAYQQRPLRQHYRLTDKGRDLFPVVLGLMQWGNRWSMDAATPPTRLRHQRCGHAVEPRTVCSACGDVLRPRDVRVELSGKLRAERQALTDSYLDRKRA